MKTVWKTVLENENYQVSNKGKIRAIARTFITANGRTYNKKEKYLKAYVNASGYHYVTFTNDKGERKTSLVHRVVCSAFKDNVEGYEQVNHINGDKSDNSVDNVEWCSASMNIQHAYDNGLHGRIEGNIEAREVRVTNLTHNTVTYYSSVTKCANDLNIKSGYISLLANGKVKKTKYNVKIEYLTK